MFQELFEIGRQINKQTRVKTGPALNQFFQNPYILGDGIANICPWGGMRWRGTGCAWGRRKSRADW